MNIARLKFFVPVLLLLVAAQGCVVAPAAPNHGYYRPGPPDHAPAHGYRQKYRYNYYPEASVYFDLDRRLYFYMDGGWRSAQRLPRDLRVRLQAPVSLELAMAEPYLRYDEHRHKYPAGRGKHKWK